MLEELQLVPLPLVEASQLIGLASQIEEALQSRVLQMVGTWQEGTVMTIILPEEKSLACMLHLLGNLPGIEATTEHPPTDAVSRQLLQRTEAIPRLNNRIRKTIILSVEKNWSWE